MAGPPRGHHDLVGVGAAVADIDPAAAPGGRPHGLDALRPQVGEASAALGLPAGLARGCEDAVAEALVGQAEDLAAGGDGQDVVLQEAFAVTVADAADVCEGLVRGEVQLGVVVDGQSEGLPGHVAAGVFAVGGEDGLVGGLGAVAEVVDGAEGVPVEGLGQGGLGSVGESGGGLDEPPGAPGVAELGVGEVVLCPLEGVGEEGHKEILCRKPRSHTTLSSLCQARLVGKRQGVSPLVSTQVVGVIG